MVLKALLQELILWWSQEENSRYGMKRARCETSQVDLKTTWAA